METVLKDAKITLRDLQIRLLRPDVAIVHQHDRSQVKAAGAESCKRQPASASVHCGRQTCTQCGLGEQEIGLLQ